MKIVTILALLLLSPQAFAENLLEKSFGEWLVSCKLNNYTQKKECFIGTRFSNEEGSGFIVFTKHYLAVAHNELNLNNGIDLKLKTGKTISSYMNTGVNVFFNNSDRKILSEEFSKGGDIEIDIKGITTITKSIDGFEKAYNFYNNNNN